MKHLFGKSLCLFGLFAQISYSYASTDLSHSYKCQSIYEEAIQNVESAHKRNDNLMKGAALAGTAGIFGGALLFPPAAAVIFMGGTVVGLPLMALQDHKNAKMYGLTKAHQLLLEAQLKREEVLNSYEEFSEIHAMKDVSHQTRIDEIAKELNVSYYHVVQIIHELEDEDKICRDNKPLTYDKIVKLIKKEFK